MIQVNKSIHCRIMWHTSGLVLSVVIMTHDSLEELLEDGASNLGNGDKYEIMSFDNNRQAVLALCGALVDWVIFRNDGRITIKCTGNVVPHFVVPKIVNCSQGFRSVLRFKSSPVSCLDFQIKHCLFVRYLLHIGQNLP